MRITAISAGVVSCALIFAINDAQASAATPLQLALNDKSASLVNDLAEDSTDQKKEEAPEAEVKETEAPEVLNHVIVKGESLDKIANKYKEEHKTTWKRLYDKNTQIDNPDFIAEGDSIVIPQAAEKLTERELPGEERPIAAPAPTEVESSPAPVVSTPQPAPAAVCDEATQWVRADNGECLDKPSAQPSTTSRSSAISSRSAAPQVSAAPAAPVVRGTSSGNNYSYGYCTWYVKNRRPDLPNNLGNADTWASRARAQGIATGSTPRVGAVAQALTGYMHVAIVDRVNGDGTVTLSEMNFRGWNVTSSRTVSARNFVYIY